MPGYILLLAKLKEEGRSFQSEQAKTYPLNYLLHVGVKLTFIKVFIILFYPACWNREHPGNFQNKSVSSSFSSVSRYVLFLAKVKGRGRPFWRVQEGGRIVRLPPRAFGCHKRWKVSTFVKFKIILLLLCFSLYLLTNKHSRTWGSLINLWIDSRICQK